MYFDLHHGTATTYAWQKDGNVTVFFVNVFTGIVTTIWIWKKNIIKVMYLQWMQIVSRSFKYEIWCSKSIEEFLINSYINNYFSCKLS